MRKIIYVDMDCFFATVEMRDIPLAIASGVIGPNYPARRYGVRA